MLRRVLIVTILLPSWSGAEASPLPPYSVIGDLAFNQSPPNRLFPNDFGSFSLVDGRFGSVSLVAAGQPSPSLRADAIIGPNLLPSIFGRGDALLNYALEIVGPPGVVPVLVSVTGTASGASDSGASFAVESRWDLFDGNMSLAGDDIRSGQLSGRFSQSFDRTVSLMLTANQVYSVFMLADAASAATLEGSSATARAFIDPIFSFGPGVDSRLYSFNFSDGIGNVGPTATTVPEPCTLALLGTGLISVGPFVRRRARRRWANKPR
jgi:hypothetical protein